MLEEIDVNYSVYRGRAPDARFLARPDLYETIYTDNLKIGYTGRQFHGTGCYQTLYTPYILRFVICRG